jgi:hypothetical protein
MVAGARSTAADTQMPWLASPGTRDQAQATGPTSLDLCRFPQSTPIGGMRRSTRTSARHPVLEVNWLSAPPSAI